jgi:RecA/RadA recombinase
MAKKKGGKFTFSQIGDLMNDMSKKMPIVINDNEEHSLIGTGIYILNAMLSGSLFGGIQSNRITVFAGDSGVGKSFLAYGACREAQKDGWNIIYIDTEFSIQRKQLPSYGIDISEDKFMLVRSNVIEDLKIMLTKILDSLKEQKKTGVDIPKTMLVLDSVGMLASRKEVEDAKDGKEKADMTRAKSLNSLFRIISSDLGYLDIPMIVTNHTYETMDLFPQAIMKGGKGLYYSASSIAFLTKAKLKTGNEDDMDVGQSGIVVTAKSMKNRLAKPKKVKFEIDFTRGSNPYKGLQAFCRGEYFDQIGIAQGKWEDFKTPVVDEDTGEEKYGEFKAGAGNRWYVRHLGKHMYEKELYTSKIFTPEVLEKMEPIVNDYFKYKSLDEMEEHQKQYDEISEANDDGLDVDNVEASDLFD